jgi:hypothetical protein
LEKAQPWPEVGQGEHIAGVALFLASEDSRFVTGAALIADGGLTATGGNAIRALAQDQLAGLAVGVDRGTTGEDGTVRMVEG